MFDFDTNINLPFFPCLPCGQFSYPSFFLSALVFIYKRVSVTLFFVVVVVCQRTLMYVPLVTEFRCSYLRLLCLLLDRLPVMCLSNLKTG